jgi:5'-methylthioadenosine phosphorylase
MDDSPVLGVIGGSGLYHMEGLENTESIEVQTPFGSPSSPLVIGKLGGKKVAFLARHGIGHHISPSEVNYRANIYALKSLGIQQVVSISACGSLREDYAPGHIVIPDQIFDFTHKRARSFFGEGLVAHVGVADPFCSKLSTALYNALIQAGAVVHRGGTFITIEGPRFSTRGESNTYRAWGMSVIGMTACPEIFLAREAEMCYTTMAHVTDYDVWHFSEQPVSVEMVIRTLMHNTEIAQLAVKHMVRDLLPSDDCECHQALASAIITQRDRIPPETIQKLGVLVDKYLKT